MYFHYRSIYIYFSTTHVDSFESKQPATFFSRISHSRINILSWGADKSCNWVRSNTARLKATSNASDLSCWSSSTFQVRRVSAATSPTCLWCRVVCCHIAGVNGIYKQLCRHPRMPPPFCGPNALAKVSFTITSITVIKGAFYTSVKFGP